jgi:radical SAM family uncharacterized protein/radical SAM-linked protein
MNLSVTESSLRGRIDAILPRVAKPARYMGGELGSISKPLEEVSVRVALAFPDVYEVGMSNLGLRILYSVLNNETAVAAERVFAPASDMEEEMRTAAIPLFSLETSSPIRDFDLVGFSLAYEMACTTVLNMLDLASIPVLARDRADSDPIVIAGGHCATNPEPMADFIDAFVIGDGEEVVLDLVNAFQRARSAKTGSKHPEHPEPVEGVEGVEGARNRVLAALAEVEGVYVPSISKGKIRGRVVLDLEEAHFPESMIVPFTEAVHDRVALEIMRGCTRGCRFCQAGMITRPVRERSLDTLCEQAQTLLDSTGYEEIALTSLSSADHSGIGDLVRELIDRHESDRVGVSLPSLRADARCVALAAQIQRVRKSGLTFAPEAGTQRLRDVVNKNVTEQDLLDAVQAAVESGWKRVKLYFMIGLPTETDNDIAGIGELVGRVIDIGRRNRVPLVVGVTISPFVPKPHTPFQWRPMATADELERKIALVRPLLRGKNISLSWHDPLCSRVEGALARGDRSLGKVIYEAWQHGGKFEQDSFSSDRWTAAFEAAGLDIASYANAELPKDAALPWEFVDVGVSKAFLAREDDKAERGEATPDCRSGECSACGVCTESIEPRVQSSKLETSDAARRETFNSQLSTFNSVAVLFTFRKGREVKWLGHLDLMRAFERAIRMSKIDVAFTQGFNPRVKMSIASALPLGATADNDLVTIHVAGQVDVKNTLIRLNACLPEGIKLTSAQILPAQGKGVTVVAGEFIVELALPDEESLSRLRAAADELMARAQILWLRESEKKRRTVDLRPGIEELRVESEEQRVLLVLRVKHLEFTVKPAEVVAVLAESVPGIETVSVHRANLVTF